MDDEGPSSPDMFAAEQSDEESGNFISRDISQLTKQIFGLNI